MKNTISSKEHKKILTQILLYISQIAEKNNINYSLIGGSLIGAIRNGGIIPWDDDIDIILDVENYNKLIEAIDKDNSDRYKVVNIDTENTYYYPYAKIVDTNTSLVEKGCKHINNYGAYIDVFCYHNAPKNKIARAIHYYKIQMYKILFSGYAYNKISKGSKYRLLKRIGKVYCNIFGIKRVICNYKKLLAKYDNKNSDVVISDWPCYGSKKEYQTKSSIEEYMKQKFESMKVKIFKDYDTILRTTFGDYMTPPPTEKQISHHSMIVEYREKQVERNGKIKVLHILDVKNPLCNGVATAVKDYIRNESGYADVALYSLGSEAQNDRSSHIFESKKYNNIKSLPGGFSSPDIVVFNEIYKKKYIKLYKECLKNNIPYIIIPHGCLVKEAQSKKYLKKKIANVLLFRAFIEHASAIQFLNEIERNNSISINKKTIISGNGIDIKKKKNHFNACIKNIIYIGRYDVKTKGLDLIINTCMKNAEWFRTNNVAINLYGRDSTNTRKELALIVERDGISDIVKVNDAVYDIEKESVLLNSYAFIQTSRHEGQPMGVLEALSYGLPCIVTFGTSFGDYVNNNKCGIGISFDEDELFEAVKKITEDEKLRNMYSRNSKIIEAYYEWHEVSRKCIEEYKELI